MRREPFSVPVQFRTTPQLAAAVEIAARQAHQSVSELLRQAVLARVREMGVTIGDGRDARAA